MSEEDKQLAAALRDVIHAILYLRDYDVLPVLERLKLATHQAVMDSIVGKEKGVS